LVLKAKLKGKDWQYELLEEAIRSTNFLSPAATRSGTHTRRERERNKALRYWMENQGVSKKDAKTLCDSRQRI
jgi:putative transposase